MFKKIIASLLVVTLGMLSANTIAVYADDEVTTENVIVEQPVVENYKVYEQTKPAIIDNNINELTGRLEYCDNFDNPGNLSQNIANELLNNVILNNVNTTLNQTSSILANELSDFSKKKSKELAVGQTLYGDITASYDEEFLLAVIIFCEAGNQSYEGKVAVGNVVLNRVASPRFKQNTIEGVIRAPGQFQPVGMGWYDRELKKGTVNESCMQAARDALNGVNIVGDCLFFHRTKGYDAGMILGDHVFY